MGVEYKHYLIPSDPDFAPDIMLILIGIDLFRQENWIPKTSQTYAQISTGKVIGSSILNQEWLRAHKNPCLLLGWTIESRDPIGIRYPLRPKPEQGPLYYTLQIHLSDDFVYHTSELIPPFLDEIRCVCGTNLEYRLDPRKLQDPFDASRIRRVCSECTQLFNPKRLSTRIQNGWTGETTLVQGGATYRFAIMIDCGKCIPSTENGRIQVEKPLLDLCQTLFQQNFQQISDIY